MPYKMKAIGIVRTDAGRRRYDGLREVVSEVIIDSECEEALDGLEDFSHIYVLFYLHEVDRPFKTKIHPTGNPELPLVGAFATRTPNRPNPIAQSLVKLLSRKGNILTVEGLDAFDGSPVLDIKPFTYCPRGDEVKVPDWIEKLRN
jgi:tRNA-Thr(GGU) m(6)t(6)A37 methyltransferase TsaA